MTALKAEEVNPESGRLFAYVYTGDSSSFELQRRAFKMFTGTVGGVGWAGLWVGRGGWRGGWRG